MGIMVHSLFLSMGSAGCISSAVVGTYGHFREGSPQFKKRGSGEARKDPLEAQI